MSQYVAVIECLSNGFYYIDDVISRGYIPLVVFCPFDSSDDTKTEHYSRLRVEAASKLEGKAEVLNSPDDFEELMSILRGYDIACVVAGSEFGVPLTDRIAARLGLRGNSPETTGDRTSKYRMHESLRRAGLRYLRGCHVGSVSDVERFWSDNDLRSAVLKLSVASASNVQKCSSLDIAKEKFAHLDNDRNIMGTESPVLLQEYVKGTEYIVNTVSFEGRHAVTQIWTNKKILVGDEGISQNCSTSMKGSFPGREALVRYVFDMLDATGVEFGPAHSELCVDEDGPVLIELNARIMGGFFPRDILDETFGDHMTDVALDSYLDPERISAYMRKSHDPGKIILTKYISAPYPTDGTPVPFLKMVRKMPGYRRCSYEGSGEEHFVKTVDLFTSSFSLVFCHSDPSIINWDYFILRSCERYYFDIVITPSRCRSDKMRRVNIGKAMDELRSDGKYAILDDDGFWEYSGGKRKEVQQLHDSEYDGGIFSLSDCNSLSEKYSRLSDLVATVRSDGTVWMLPESYSDIPYGVTGAEIILNMLGIRPELTDSLYDIGIRGTKP